MDKFYNEVDLENVDVELEDILRTMPKTAKWTVDRVDVYGGGPTRRRYFQVMIYENVSFKMFFLIIRRMISREEPDATTATSWAILLANVPTLPSRSGVGCVAIKDTWRRGRDKTISPPSPEWSSHSDSIA